MNTLESATEDQMEQDVDAEEEAEAEADTDEPEAINIRLQNIVATSNLNQRLELPKVAQVARNAEYNPRRFQAVIMRIREPRTTALIFASGKMIVTGAKTIEDSQTATKKYAAIIEKIGYAVNLHDYKVQNITASTDVGFPIRLEGLVYAHSTASTYEPEIFPGLIYRMTEPKVVLLIFVSGKIVITGAKFIDDITEAVGSIFPILAEFRKKNLVIRSVT